MSMWSGNQASYGKEPFDLRLTVLRMIRKLHIIIGFTLLGTLLFGGGYYVINVLLHDDITYEVTSTYKVSFVNEPSQSGDYYINAMTWNTYVQSGEFLDAVWKHLQEDTIEYDSVFVSSVEELSPMLTAKLDSDVHIPSTVVTTQSQEWTVLIAKAVEAAMVEEFVEGNEQIAAIKVIDPAVTAAEVVPDVRPVRAFVLSGILSFFFVMVILLIRELGNDDIWLPATLRRRYGLPVIGTVNSPEAKANLEYLLGECKKVAVCPVQEQVNPMEVIADLQELNVDSNDASMTQTSGMIREWIPIPAPLLCPEACEAMRGAEAVLLVVKAGEHAGKPLEYILEYLETQDIKVMAALLWETEEWLLRSYYMLPENVQ